MKPRSSGLDIETIARLHYDAVYRFCYRRLGADRAADAAQETFLTAQRVIGKFRGESSVTTWLFGIANNECRRLSRTARLTPPIVELDPGMVGERSHESKSVDRTALAEALSRLSEEHREVVLMHEVEGLTYEEIAEIVGAPVGTIKSRLHHAFVGLRRALDPLGGSV